MEIVIYFKTGTGTYIRACVYVCLAARETFIQSLVNANYYVN